MAGQQPIISLGLVLMQTFLVIFLGASVVRIGFLKPEDARVVGFITGRLALPLLIFRAVATAEVQAVDFNVVGVLVGSKLAVQLLTMIGAAIVAKRKPGQRLLDAGLFGLYATSSADFPIGFPVVMALFHRESEMMADFCSYLTMLAVAQDLLGNVVALVALEAGRAQQAAAASSGAARTPRSSLLRAIALNVAGNHLLWMVFSGIVFKLAFGWLLVRTPTGLRLPIVLNEAVEMLTSPFKFLVLFQVGISVGSLTTQTFFAEPLKFLGVLLLNMIKLVFLPLLMVSLLLLTWSGTTEQRNEFLTFTLIYGTLPSPAAIVAFARLYGIHADVLGMAVPVGLALSGPIIWGVATLGHLYMHSTDNMWQGDSRLELYLQYPGLVCGASLLILFATGCSNWRVFPMGAFVLCSLALLGWHICKVILVCFGCGVPALVHYLFHVFNQQVRLCGVMTLWLAWGLLRGVEPLHLKFAFAVAFYILPAILAVPALIGPEMNENPFWIMSCLYVRMRLQRTIDLASCGVSFAALLVACVLFARAGGFHDKEELHSPPEALPESLAAPTPSALRRERRRVRTLTSFDQFDLDSFDSVDLGRRSGSVDTYPIAMRSETRARTSVSINSFPIIVHTEEVMAAQTSKDGAWDEALRYRMFMQPALAMGLYAALLLPLDAALAVMRSEMSSAWRAAITTAAALVHCSQGCILLLLFLWSEPACRIYQGAFVWISAVGERLYSNCDNSMSDSETDEKEDHEEEMSAELSSNATTD